MQVKTVTQIFVPPHNYIASISTLNLSFVICVFVIFFPDFDNDGTAEGITFIVNRIKIWSDPNESGYKFASNYAVETFLSMFSENEDFSAYCLAYIFTYRDYDGGTLGLAWTGSTTSAGGVCQDVGVNIVVKTRTFIL